jgi:hypothetical protein
LSQPIIGCSLPMPQYSKFAAAAGAASAYARQKRMLGGRRRSRVVVASKVRCPAPKLLGSETQSTPTAGSQKEHIVTAVITHDQPVDHLLCRANVRCPDIAIAKAPYNYLGNVSGGS